MELIKNKKAATIYDIAKTTGVTAATVSRVLNNKGYIAEETRDKIIKAAKQLNYSPNPAARTLKTRRTNQVMLSIPDMRNQFYFDMIAAIQEVAKAKGYSLILNYTEADEKEEINCLRNVRENFIDGLILISINITEKLISEVKNIHQPIVLSGICKNTIKETDRAFDYVGVDTGKGLYLAAKHLIGQGHTHIGYIGLSLNTQPGSERFTGFCLAMNESGLNVDDRFVRIGGFTEGFGYEAGLSLVKQDSLPTAVCASSDIIALGIYRAFEQEGISIPADISVVGMDNTDITTRIKPKMTTVAISQAEIGRTATELIFKRLNGFIGPYQTMIFQPRLIVRESSINVVYL